MIRPKYGYLYTLPLFVWISLFFVIPIAIVLTYSVLTRDYAGGVIWQFSLDAYGPLFSDVTFWLTMKTLLIAVISSVITILIALPVAYYMAQNRGNSMLLMLVIVPFWVNLLIRVLAWIAILGNNGFLNDLLQWTGLSSQPVQFMYNQTAVIIVHVYSYLPYAILPLYATIERFDFGLLEAARDLGSTHRRSLMSVLLPNIRSGIVTAILFTFIPTLGSYAIPQLVGGKDGYMLGNAVADSMGQFNNWPRAAAISVLITVITSLGLLVYFLVNRAAKPVVIEEEA